MFPADHRSEDAGDEVFGVLSSSEKLLSGQHMFLD